MSTLSNLAIIESELKGKTLQVYWYLLQSRSSSVGPREVARSLGFSSPSVALHHLEKLQSLGLVEKSETGEYKLVREVRVGVLRSFIKLWRLWVPRYFFLFGVVFSNVYRLSNLLRTKWLRSQYCCYSFRLYSLCNSMV